MLSTIHTNLRYSAMILFEDLRGPECVDESEFVLEEAIYSNCCN